MRLSILLILSIVFEACAGLAHIRGDSGPSVEDCSHDQDSGVVTDQHPQDAAGDTSDAVVVSEDADDGGSGDSAQPNDTAPTDDGAVADDGAATDDSPATDSPDSGDSGSPNEDAPVVSDGGNEGGDAIDTCIACFLATTQTIMAPGGLDYYGSTIGQPNHYVAGCRPSASPEMVYRIVLTAPATFEADTLGSAYDTILFLRSGCCDGPEVACNDDNPGAGSTSSIMVHLDAGTYYLFVDGFNGMSGLYTLNVRINP